ncbi:uncharacterized protein TNIN_339281 [Trichonephila inaurata madagascariensis]|uniref:Uncharacterized protein n=1 Tax=Trichonephila inaurata madagascariensis TaxID=2747483 RepID=A0A8X6XKL2_9ARAC|nr:uncharacterized protein TNIN_339281 [Trichonephila inaurata madagascariensis]
MAYSGEKYCRRQKACLVVSVLILILGLLLIVLGVLFSLQSRNRKCHKVKHVLIGVYSVIAGISGIVGYWPRKAHLPLKDPPTNRSRGSVAIFLIFCTLVTVGVVLDPTTFDCILSHEARSSEALRLYVVLGLVEAAGMHIAHLLCALCIGLSCPDWWSSKHSKSDNSSTKHKSSTKALHLPEARTYIQEAAGTGDKVTVVSLPETDGIVYAVPEQQYVIRRGEATYMAPAGNTSMTAFFPTYRTQTN